MPDPWGERFRRITDGVTLGEPDPMDCAPPLAWHPWYGDRQRRPELARWLDGDGPDCIRLPVLPPVVASFFTDAAEPDVTVPREIVLTRKRAAGPAPYVGCPFAYGWTVGVDSNGRQIASDSHVHYLPHRPRRDCTCGTADA